MRNISFTVQVEAYNSKKFQVQIFVNEGGIPIHRIKSILDGSCGVLHNGYVVNDSFVSFTDLVTRVMTSEDETEYLQYLYKPGDMVLYKSSIGANPTFGIVEANEFKQYHVFVRLEYLEGYYINVNDLQKIG